MPSGISHMLLSRWLPVEKGYHYYKIRYNTRYFQIGSIAPDLPYASIIDNNFLENESVLANLFHFTEKDQDPTKSPNRLPVWGVEQVKSMIEAGADKRACDALFWFVVGYASHVIADGVCHPYVMDKVGRYEGSNKADHRALEMGIDVLLLEHLTSPSGHAIQATYAGMDSFIKDFNRLRHSDFVLEQFARFIDAVYTHPVDVNEIRGWVTGISRLFCLSTGVWPAWFRRLDISAPYVFRRIEDLKGRENDYLLLKKPKYWDKNFRRKPTVHFFDDCVPQFNRLMKSFLDKAYGRVYESGPPIGEADLPAFSLDTGRRVEDPNNLELEPVLWEAE